MSTFLRKIQLAVIYERNKGELPSQYQSTFGKMIEDIANALNVKDSIGYPVTWNGHVNEILQSEAYSRLRQEPTYQYRFDFFEDAINEAENDEQWQSIVEDLALFRKVANEGTSKGLKDLLNQMKFEERINGLPDSDAFNISIDRKYNVNSD